MRCRQLKAEYRIEEGLWANPADVTFPPTRTVSHYTYVDWQTDIVRHGTLKRRYRTDSELIKSSCLPAQTAKNVNRLLRV